MGKQSKVEATQRREAVLSLLRKEEPGAALARRYGVSEATLYRWRDDFITAGAAALADGKGGNGASERRIAELEQQIEKRDQVIGELTIANRIFKKLSGQSL